MKAEQENRKIWFECLTECHFSVVETEFALLAETLINELKQKEKTHYFEKATLRVTRLNCVVCTGGCLVCLIDKKSGVQWFVQNVPDYKTDKAKRELMISILDPLVNYSSFTP